MADQRADAPRSDLPRSDLPRSDLPRSDLPRSDLPRSDLCVQPPGWWNGSYRRRVRLAIASTSLPAGYSVVATVDTQALISGGQLLGSGNDLRVVRQGSVQVELDRRLVGVGATDTKVWFLTQAAVTGTDDTYYLYYDNPSAGTPPAAWADSMGSTSKVYLAADDFEDDTVGATPGGWVGSTNYKVELDGTNKVLSVNGTSPAANYLFAGDFTWKDIAVEARLRVLVTTGQHYGLWTRATSATNFDTLWFGLATGTSLQCYTCRIASPAATGLTSSTVRGSWSLTPAAGTTWHTVAVRYIGQTASFFFDSNSVGSYTISSTSMTQGRVGLCAGYATSHAHWDDVVVRRHVSPEPTVSVGAVQSACP